MLFPAWTKSLLARFFATVGIIAALFMGIIRWQYGAYTQAQEMKSALKIGQPITTVLPLLQAQHHDDWNLFDAKGNILGITGSPPPTSPLKKVLEENASGRLSVMLTSFVFHRFFVNVDFEDRKITDVRLSELD